MIRSKTAMEFLWALLALLLHVLPGVVGPAHAHLSRKDDIILFNSRGIPMAGATVRVCAMPASSQPCTPLALDDIGMELGPLGPGVQTNVSNNWTAQQNLSADMQFKGSNPYVDARAYGVRGGTASTAATTTSRSPTLTLRAASTFQNGDGVVIYGAGAVQTMTAPSAPTVTPSVARGPTGTGDVVNGPAGSTSYNYKVIWRDIGGGFTAASAAGSTTTGSASLGSQSVNITSMSRSNNTVTVTTTSANGLVTGSMVYIATNSNGLTDNSFAGWYQVSGSADNTHFTFISGQDTRNGASVSATGGTAFWFNCNHVTWGVPPAGGYQAYIYSDRANPGTFALVGVAKPLNPTISGYTDLTQAWDDFGSPMMDNLTAVPPNIPSTAPSSPSNDSLVTTIISGAGTTTLTLAANAGTSTTNTIKNDDSAPLLAAATAAGSSGSVYTPMGVRPIINSVLNLGNPGPKLVTPGGLTLNDTLILGAPNWSGGGAFAPASNYTSFSFDILPSVTCNATPCVYVTSGQLGHVEGIHFSGASNNALLILQDGKAGSPGPTYEHIALATPGSSVDYMSTVFWGRGTTLQGFVAQFAKVLAFSGPNQSPDGDTATPLVYFQEANQVVIDSIFMNRRGIVVRPLEAGGMLEIKWGYRQGGKTPFVTVGGNNISAGTHGQILKMSNITQDTEFLPAVTYLPSAGSVSLAFNGFNVVGPQGGNNVFTGNPIKSANNVGSTNGQNFNLSTAPVGTALDNIFSTNVGLGYGNYLNANTNGSLSVGSNYPIFVNGVAPAQPTCSVGAGGSIAVGSHTYKIVPVWQNGAEGNVSIASATCTTTSGNQTVTVNYTAVPGNPKGYNLYQDGLFLGNGTLSCSSPNVSVSLNPIVLSGGSSCGGSGPSNVPAGGPTMLMPGTQGIAAPSINIGGGGLLGPPSAGFTATRTQTLPDVTGYIPVTSYVNSVYDNATRANGAIGSNWTVTNNGINISSNNFVGTSASNDAAYWSASSFSNVQFSQVTITALNGTTDFPGVAVLLSGSGASTQGYECVEDTTNIFIQKISGTTNTTLTSAASTGTAGDILRLEVAPGGALTCYKNSVSTLKTTNTTYTSGAPGLFLFGTVATSKNWSGGNFHPLAQLDSEQDWTKTQHFAQGIALGGAASESFKTNPRAEQNVFLPGALTSTWTGATWTIDKAVTITRVQVQAKTAPSGCTTNTVVRLTDGTTPVNVTISAAANDSGAISQSYAAGSALTVAVQTAAAGCTTRPADANVVVQYRMQ
jgi:hypothetical protein